MAPFISRLFLFLSLALFSTLEKWIFFKIPSILSPPLLRDRTVGRYVRYFDIKVEATIGRLSENEHRLHEEKKDEKCWGREEGVPR